MVNLRTHIRTRYLATLIRLRRRAAIIGENWAKLAALADLQMSVLSWTADPVMRELARQKITHLTADEDLVSELVAACLAGAARWWVERTDGIYP